MSPAAEIAGIVDSKQNCFSIFENFPIVLALCLSPGHVLNLIRALQGMLGRQRTLRRFHLQKILFTPKTGARTSKSISETTGPSSRPPCGGTQGENPG